MSIRPAETSKVRKNDEGGGSGEWIIDTGSMNGNQKMGKINWERSRKVTEKVKGRRDK